MRSLPRHTIIPLLSGCRRPARGAVGRACRPPGGGRRRDGRGRGGRRRRASSRRGSRGACRRRRARRRAHRAGLVAARELRRMRACPSPCRQTPGRARCASAPAGRARRAPPVLLLSVVALRGLIEGLSTPRRRRTRDDRRLLDRRDGAKFFAPPSARVLDFASSKRRARHPAATAPHVARCGTATAPERRAGLMINLQRRCMAGVAAGVAQDGAGHRLGAGCMSAGRRRAVGSRHIEAAPLGDAAPCGVGFPCRRARQPRTASLRMRHRPARARLKVQAVVAGPSSRRRHPK